MSLKIVFLDSGTLYDQIQLSPLQQLGEVIFFEHTTYAQTLERAAAADVVITNKVVLDATLLRALPNLKLICVAATGTNNIDAEAAAALHIPVKNVVDYSTPSVVQTTWAMALYLRMQIHTYHHFVQNGSYATHPYFTHLSPSFHELKGQTWGIIGLGNIGRGVADVAKSFGMRVVAHSVSGNVQEGEIDFLSLQELLTQSDVVSVHVPLSPKTYGLIHSENIRYMKPSAVLINVARGGIVDEFALAEAIDCDLIAGAAIDVFSVEPIQPDNPLLHVRKSHKILLTPHIAWGSVEARNRLVIKIAENIRNHFGMS